MPFLSPRKFPVIGKKSLNVILKGEVEIIL